MTFFLATVDGTRVDAVGRQETNKAGNFEITKDNAGKFRFRLKAGNGEIIAVSEAYESMASAKNGIESVKKNAAEAAVVDLTG